MALLLVEVVVMSVKVEMRPAYEWTCEECGRNQFASCMVAEWSQEDRLEQARQAGLIDRYETEVPEGLRGDFVTYPDAVECQSCGESYETKDMGEK